MMAKREVAQCRCCRLPLERPRRLWAVVVPVRRKPRLVAVCRACWMQLGQLALSLSVVGVNRVVVVGEEDYEAQRQWARGLQASGQPARVG